MRLLVQLTVTSRRLQHSPVDESKHPALKPCQEWLSFDVPISDCLSSFGGSMQKIWDCFLSNLILWFAIDFSASSWVSVLGMGMPGKSLAAFQLKFCLKNSLLKGGLANYLVKNTCKTSIWPSWWLGSFGDQWFSSAKLNLVLCIVLVTVVFGQNDGRYGAL